MQLYRFSPIWSREQLFEVIEYVHFAAYKFCKRSFGEYLPNSGKVAVFSHYTDEFDRLTNTCKSFTEPSDGTGQEYLKFTDPIIIPGRDDLPETTYTHLRIRRPDPYRAQVGYVDFSVDPDKFADLKQPLLKGKIVKGARLYPGGKDMIELYDPDVDILAYVMSKEQI